MKKDLLCRGCGGRLCDSPVLAYENMPVAAQYFPDDTNVADEKGAELKLYQCDYCGLMQLQGDPVPYYKDVIRASGISDWMKEYRHTYFNKFVETYGLKGRKVLEIGAGCGEFLSVMAQTGARAYGIEHLDAAVEVCIKKGLRVSQDFIDSENKELADAPFDGFYIMNFLEHIPEPNTFLKGIYRNLKEEAVGLIEVPDMDMALDNLLFSEFIQDHLLYFTRQTLVNLLERNGFEVLSCKSVWHGYVLAAEVRKRKKERLDGFHMQLEKISLELHDFVDAYVKQGKKVAVWGAGHQALALLALTEIYKDIAFVIDSAEFKQNKYTPGTHLNIYSPQILESESVDAIIVMAASYSEEVACIIREKYADIKVAVFRETGLVRI